MGRGGGFCFFAAGVLVREEGDVSGEWRQPPGVVVAVAEAASVPVQAGVV